MPYHLIDFARLGKIANFLRKVALVLADLVPRKSSKEPVNLVM